MTLKTQTFKTPAEALKAQQALFEAGKITKADIIRVTKQLQEQELKAYLDKKYPGRKS